MYTLLFVIAAFAAETSDAKPATLLEAARNNYDAKLEAANAKITAEYVKELDSMLKKAMVKGDKELTAAILEELKLVKQERLNNSLPSIVGTWDWVGTRKTFYADGTMKENGSSLYGRWQVVDKKTRQYRLLWFQDGKPRFVDTGTLSSDGNRFSARNNQGTSFTGTRVVEEH